ADFAAFRQKHGPEAMPSDFNDLAQIRGLDAVKQVVQQPVASQAMVSQTSSEFAKQQRQEVPASVFGPQEQNRIEPDLDQVIEKGTSEHPAKPGQSDQEHTTAEPNADIQKPSSGPTMTTAS